jgi:hypothetical protein
LIRDKAASKLKKLRNQAPEIAWTNDENLSDEAQAGI